MDPSLVAMACCIDPFLQCVWAQTACKVPLAYALVHFSRWSWNLAGYWMLKVKVHMHHNNGTKWGIKASVPINFLPQTKYIGTATDRTHIGPSNWYDQCHRGWYPSLGLPLWNLTLILRMQQTCNFIAYITVPLKFLRLSATMRDLPNWTSWPRSTYVEK